METSLGQPEEKERIEARVTKEMKDLILKASLMKVRSTVILWSHQPLRLQGKLSGQGQLWN